MGPPARPGPAPGPADRSHPYKYIAVSDRIANQTDAAPHLSRMFPHMGHPSE